VDIITRKFECNYTQQSRRMYKYLLLDTMRLPEMQLTSSEKALLTASVQSASMYAVLHVVHTDKHVARQIL